MSTATTLGAACASLVSMAVIFAWANGLRTIARCSIPGSWMLSVQLVRPVISRWSSLRRRALPISRFSAGRSSVAVMTDAPPLAVVAEPAADCTALTMLW